MRSRNAPMKPSLRTILLFWFVLVSCFELPLPLSADATPSNPIRQTTDTTNAPAVPGKQLYGRYCEQCHQADGLGVAERFPPLVGSEWVTGPSRTVIRIILNGLEGPISVAGRNFDGVMPAGRNQLSDREIAAIATFLRQWESNQAPAVSAAEVREIRRSSIGRVRPWTESELRGSHPIWPWIALLLIIAAFLALWLVRRALHGFHGRANTA